MMLAGSAEARDAGLLAFSRDGSQALIESYDRDREEGGRRFTYLVVGGGETVSAEPDNTISHGAGPQQHVTPQQCLAAMKTLERALRKFPAVKLHPDVCHKKERSGLLEAHRPPDGSFALANGVLSRGDLTLASDGEKVVLARAGAALATFAVKIPAGSLGATMSPTGQLLLLYYDTAGESLAAIAESKSGRPEDLVLRAH